MVCHLLPFAKIGQHGFKVYVLFNIYKGGSLFTEKEKETCTEAVPSSTVECHAQFFFWSLLLVVNPGVYNAVCMAPTSVHGWI